MLSCESIDAGDNINVFHCVVEGRAFVANSKVESCRFHYFSTTSQLKYEPLCDDFGPMNMSCVVRFIEIMEEQTEMYPSGNIVYLVERGRRPFTNGAFLMGSYMILKLQMKPEDVWSKFSVIDSHMLEPFRDATYSPVDFGLSLLDCWRGLHRAISLGWLRTQQAVGIWGMIDIDDYETLENPLNGDMVEVVPGKFVAFKGPKDLGGRTYRDDNGYREFSPTYYADIFDRLNVRTVVRLNESRYDPALFEERGIAHFDLHFEDCTSPPQHIVDEFLRIVDEAGKSVAVHCKAGLGRTGTLIALYLMRTYNFAAREAIGWLRIMRPGCVIGQQQQYLCAVDAAFRGRQPPAVKSLRRRSLPAINLLQAPIRVAQGPESEGVETPTAATLAAQVSAAIDRRASFRPEDRRRGGGLRELPTSPASVDHAPTIDRAASTPTPASATPSPSSRTPTPKPAGQLPVLQLRAGAASAVRAASHGVATIMHSVESLFQRRASCPGTAADAADGEPADGPSLPAATASAAERRPAAAAARRDLRRPPPPGDSAGPAGERAADPPSCPTAAVAEAIAPSEKRSWETAARRSRSISPLSVSQSFSSSSGVATAAAAVAASIEPPKHGRALRGGGALPGRSAAHAKQAPAEPAESPGVAPRSPTQGAGGSAAEAVALRQVPPKDLLRARSRLEAAASFAALPTCNA